MFHEILSDFESHCINLLLKVWFFLINVKIVSTVPILNSSAL